MPDITWRAVLLGASVALAVGLPASVLAGLTDGANSPDDNSSWVFVFLAVTLVGMAVGGAAAARRRPDTPLTHGALAAFFAFVPIQTLGAASQLINDDTSSLSLLGVVFSAIMLTTAGVIGAAISQGR